MRDESPKLTYLLSLSVVLQGSPSPEQVRALLDKAQRSGVEPNWLHLSALRLHPQGLALPRDSRLVLEVSLSFASM